MKKGMTRSGYTALRLITASLILFLLAFSFLSYRATRMLSDVVQQLGTTDQKLQENIETSFFQDYLHYYGATKIKSILVNDRPAIAKDLAAYLKQYVTSDAFKKKYSAFRQDMKPEEPIAEPKTKEDIRKERIAEL